MGRTYKCDLVKGGEVLDPSQRLRGKLDLGIRYRRELTGLHDEREGARPAPMVARRVEFRAGAA